MKKLNILTLVTFFLFIASIQAQELKRTIVHTQAGFTLEPGNEFSLNLEKANGLREKYFEIEMDIVIEELESDKDTLLYEVKYEAGKNIVNGVSILTNERFVAGKMGLAQTEEDKFVWEYGPIQPIAKYVPSGKDNVEQIKYDYSKPYTLRIKKNIRTYSRPNKSSDEAAYNYEILQPFNREAETWDIYQIGLNGTSGTTWGDYSYLKNKSLSFKSGNGIKLKVLEVRVIGFK